MLAYKAKFRDEQQMLPLNHECTLVCIRKDLEESTNNTNDDYSH